MSAWLPATQNLFILFFFQALAETQDTWDGAGRGGWAQLMLMLNLLFHSALVQGSQVASEVVPSREGLPLPYPLGTARLN